MRSFVARAGATSTSRKRGTRIQIIADQEALSQQLLIDYVASSEDDLFRQIARPSTIKRFDGKTVN